MSVCGNCGAQITCNCQYRDTSDGRKACGNCIESYEIQLNAKRIEAAEVAKLNDRIINQYINNEKLPGS